MSHVILRELTLANDGTLSITFVRDIPGGKKLFTLGNGWSVGIAKRPSGDWRCDVIFFPDGTTLTLSGKSSEELWAWTANSEKWLKGESS